MLRSIIQVPRRCFSREEIYEAASMLDIGTRRIFNEDHDMFRESCRKFIQTEIVPYHKEYEKNGQIDRKLWNKAGDMGLLGISTPVYGHGGDILTSAIVWEELSYSNCSGPGFPLHSDIIMPYISKYGSEDMKKRYLPKMTTGEMVGALGMTEPGAGSDLQGIRTSAKSDGKGGFILNGSKIFISNGHQADLVLVVAITNPKAKSPAHGISLFIVENGMPGFKKGKILNKLGLKAQDTSELFFDDVHLTEENLVGELNKGFIYLMEELPRERLMIGVVSQCAAEFIFEETRRYLKERKAFGSNLANLKVLQHRLAEMKTEITVCRSFIDDCLYKLNEGTLGSEGASMAKYYASDMVNKIAGEGLQMHGGYGFMWDYEVCKAYADARVQTIYGGTNEIMKELIARNITKST